MGGLLSLVGLAVQTGVLMVSYIDDAFQRCLREGKLPTREDLQPAGADRSGSAQPLLMSASLPVDADGARTRASASSTVKARS